MRHLAKRLDRPSLRKSLIHYVRQERGNTAIVLEHIAEFDLRELFLEEACSSMAEWCARILNFTEDAAFKRIQAARSAAAFPVLFDAVADGRLHLTAVCLLAPHLTPENVDELVAAASGKSKSHIKDWLARRFGTSARAEAKVVPTQTVPALVLADDGSPRLAPAQVSDDTPTPSSGAPGVAESFELAPAHVTTGTRSLAPAQVSDVDLTEEECIFHFKGDRAMRLKFEYVRSLLGHAVPSGDMATIMRRALDALAEKEEKRTHRTTPKPRSTRHAAADPRHIPANVERAVRERDGDRCAFVGANGLRCGSRTRLQFDHDPVPLARGGQSTVDNLRQLCGAHNPFEAKRVFGTGFIERKRKEAALDRDTRDVIAGLRSLGVRAEEARCAAAHAATLVGVTLEQRMKAALRSLRPKVRPAELAPAQVGGATPAIELAPAQVEDVTKPTEVVVRVPLAAAS